MRRRCVAYEPHMRCKCAADAPHMRCICTAHAVQMRRICTAYAVHMHRICSANAPQMRRMRTAYAPQMQCKCSANAVQMQCKCNVPVWQWHVLPMAIMGCASTSTRGEMWFSSPCHCALSALKVLCLCMSGHHRECHGGWFGALRCTLRRGDF